MTAASGERPLPRFVMWVAHSIPYLVMIALAVWMASLFGWLSSFTFAMAEIVLLGSFFALLTHRRMGALCMRCITDTPLNPELSVQRNKLFLRFEHRTMRQFIIIWLICCVIFNIGTWFVQGPAVRVFYLPIDALFFAQMWGFWIHHRLQPWCPYCRPWDEGGDEELVPDPDPSEGKIMT